MKKIDDLYCEACGVHFSAKPKAGPFGFMRAGCTSCLSKVVLPLTTSMRLTYWALVVLGATGISVLWMRGYWVYYIGPVLTIAITSLVIDLVIRSAGVRNATGADGSKKRRIKRLIREVAWTMGVVTAVHIVVVFAVETAEVHTVTDRPESPETFTSEQYLTGKYIVRQDDNPVCRVGQYYSDCINDYVNQYNYSCADIELTLFSSVECKSYLQNIDDMKAKDQPGWIVSGVGGPGHLSRRAEVSSRDVSNNDYEPAVTHSAVCYLGFVGECLP